MRILTIVCGLGIGGTERAAINFSLAYQRAGHEVAVMNHGADGVRRATLEAAGIPVFGGAAGVEVAVKESGRFRPDILHIHRCGWQNDRETRLLETLCSPERRVLETNVFGAADYSACRRLISVHMHLTKWCLWRWRRWIGDRRQVLPAVILPYPVDTDHIRPASETQAAALRHQLGVPDGGYLVGRVGQPLEGKWHAAAIEAFAQLARDDDSAYLVACGLPAGLRPVVARLPARVRGRVTVFNAELDDEQLRRLYSALDCFLHVAGQGECFGYVLTEAMACNVPVVTVSQPTKDNSQVEVVGHLEGGVVAGRASSVGDALRWLRSHPEVAAGIRATARSRVIARYDIQKVAQAALRIAELSLTVDSRHLMERLREDSTLDTSATDEEILALCRNTFRPPSATQLLPMWCATTPLAHRGRFWLARILGRR